MHQYISAQDFSYCQRLFHGRGHAYEGLSHVNVDWYPPVVVIILYSEVEDTWLHHQANWLSKNITGCKSVLVQRRYLSMSPTEHILGEEVRATVVKEGSLKFNIDLSNAQNSGLFLDMANGRAWLNQHAEGKNVLNLFAYTCAFSVAAIAGGAKQVVNVDISKSSLAKGRENHRLNDHNLERVKFQGVDIFKSYSRLKKFGPYDILVCDPPSFQKGSVDIARDYKKIIKRIPALVKPGGQLLLCLNSPDLDEAFLLQEVARECADCQFIEKLDNPNVYKEAHQGKGLKVLLFHYSPKC
ncbi:class I SAM-dependent methyltransferase [Thalassotalea agarivorans]|uniref:23S rRNA (Cytosine1962-C5)-methyltransferase n=1 Tax=Thalassotalea agarivorans TaxID=349064 RepID=A0A1H9YBQ1_THASX|nr:class I SAM-dependent methyltransferase [Thalassotalea agarivorans]SES66219.1 23S rRNA (cytosine1962-C5)-methyltransferase [Thalassotalea agarivorans]